MDDGDKRQESFSAASEIFSFFGYFTRTRVSGAWAARGKRKGPSGAADSACSLGCGLYQGLVSLLRCRPRRIEVSLQIQKQQVES